MRITSPWRLPLLLTCTVAFLAACAPATAEGGASAGASTSGGSRVRANVLTRAEIEGSGTTNLFDAIQRLRPQWLRNASQTNYGGGGTDIVVYQNTTLLGGPEALRQIAPGYAENVRFLDATTAMNTLPGLGQRRVAGAIVIELPR
jgi:ABC-type phosphate transport system substrate-binding protein